MTQKTKFIAVSAIAAVVMSGVALIGVFVDIRNAGIEQENSLSRQYQDNQNVLSDCVVRIREQAGIVGGQTEAIDDILEGAVKGRYGDAGELTRAGGATGGGQLISAIVEAYPDLSGVNESYQMLLNEASGCRQDYRDVQERLLDMVRTYDTWRDTGAIRWAVAGVLFPSDRLEARISSDNVAYGPAARERILEIVLVDDARQAYDSGTLEAEDPFSQLNDG